MKKHEALFVIVVFLLALGLRFYRLDRPGLSHDEALTIYLASTASPRAWFLDVHPPLHYAFYRLWLRLFPWRGSEVPVRAPQAFCGALVPALAYGVFRPLMGWKALFPSASLALSSFFVSRSRDAWRYGIVPFFALLSTFLFLQTVRGRRGSLLSYAVSSVLAVAYQWALVGTVVAHALFLLLHRRGERKRLLFVQGSIFGGTLLYVWLHMTWLGARSTPPPFLQGLKRAGILLFEAISCPVATYPSLPAAGWAANWSFALSLLSLPLLPMGILWLWRQGESGRIVGLAFLVQASFIASLAFLGLAPNPWYATLTGGLPLAIVQIPLFKRRTLGFRVLGAAWWALFLSVNTAGTWMAVLGLRQERVDHRLIANEIASLEDLVDVIVSDSIPYFYGPRAMPFVLYHRPSKPVLPSPWTWSTAAGAFEGRDGTPLPPDWREQCARLCRGKKVLGVWFEGKGYKEKRVILRGMLLRTHKVSASRKIFSTSWIDVRIEVLVPKS